MTGKMAKVIATSEHTVSIANTDHACLGCKREDITIYSVKDLKPGEVTTVTLDCPRTDTQACANYYSIIQAGRSSVFTCTASHNIGGRGESPAVDSWFNGHKDDTWKKFTAAKYDYNAKEKDIDPNCEVDE